MGGHPYWYFVKHEPDLDAVLESLREREFKAGRYNPAIPFPEFPVTAKSPSPGARHDSIDEALESSGEEGTRSILDIARISDEPDFCAASPVDEDSLEALYGTAAPTRAQVEADLDPLFDLADRGQAAYVVLFESGHPSEVLFIGYSFD